MMNDETAIIQVPGGGLADVSALADEFSKATRLTRYQEGLRDETIRRQKTDLATFARFLASIGTSPGDFYNDLSAWQGIRAGLLEAFIEWQKLQGYSIGTINVRLATVKAYCHLAYEVGILDIDTHTHIQGVKGIQRKQARNIDARRETILTFLRILFVFLSHNLFQRISSSRLERAPLMNVAVSFSRITFPCRVCHFVFGERRRLTVFLTELFVSGSRI
jgi:hypothetical protein